MSAGTPAVSVIIPSFNEERNIRRCLTALFEQRTGSSYEVIIVDSSADSTPDIVATEFPQVRLIHRERQTFPAEARNIGIEQARGDIVAFIDADCKADVRWIESIVDAHAHGHVAVGGSIRLASPCTLAGMGLFVIEFSEYGPGSPAREIRWLPSANLSVKRRAIDEFGGFPVDMEASEDIVFSRRLAEGSGVPLYWDPRIAIEHTNRNSLAGFRRKLLTLGYWSGKSRGLGLVPGGVVMRHPALIPLLVPYRLAMIVVRVLSHSRDARMASLSLVLWPLYVYGLVIWALAFRRGMRETRDAAEHSA